MLLVQMFSGKRHIITIYILYNYTNDINCLLYCDFTFVSIKKKSIFFYTFIVVYVGNYLFGQDLFLNNK